LQKAKLDPKTVPEIILHFEAFVLKEGMGSCFFRDSLCQKRETVGVSGFMQRFEKDLPRRRNCWRKWVHAEMKKDLPK